MFVLSLSFVYHSDYCYCLSFACYCLFFVKLKLFMLTQATMYIATLSKCSVCVSGEVLCMVIDIGMLLLS